MTDSRRYRTGTSTVTLPATLDQTQLRDEVRAALASELAASGEWLDRFDFGPPRRADDGHRSYDVMFRTGPPTNDQTGPEVSDAPPQLDA